MEMRKLLERSSSFFVALNRDADDRAEKTILSGLWYKVGEAPVTD